MNKSTKATLLWLLFIFSFFVSGCTNLNSDGTHYTKTTSQKPDATTLKSDAIQAIKEKNITTARKKASQLLTTQPRSSQAHILLALSHHLAGDYRSLDMAIAGYKAAKQFAGSNPWPSQLAGFAALQRKEPYQALEYFSEAVLAAPGSALAFEGLAAAAYMTGHIELAQAAAEQGRQLTPASSLAWRLATLSAAGKGDQAKVRHLLAAPPANTLPAFRKFVAQRSEVLLKTAGFDTNKHPTLASTGTNETSPSNQLSVEVTLILSDRRTASTYGVNLLEGLQAVYSLGRQVVSSRVTDTPDNKSVTITRAIRTPDINYNLNLFRNSGRFYEVIARPSLTAYQGEESTFFVGEQLRVPIGGVNIAQLETIDVGVGLKLIPNQIRSNSAQFRIEADRSFFSDQGIGQFVEGIALFKQSVAATADVRFGETLMLSGLSEDITDGQRSAFRRPGCWENSGNQLVI